MSGTELAVDTVEAVVPVEDLIADCVDVPRFAALCRDCPSYGERWSCPPYDADPMETWRRCDTAMLRARVIRPKGSITQDEAMQIMHREKEGLLHEMLALEAESPGSLALGAGKCEICDQCERPHGRPCRAPQLMRPSIEAIGGNVSLMAERYLGRPLQWFKDGRAPRYLTIVACLLTKDK